MVERLYCFSFSKMSLYLLHTLVSSSFVKTSVGRSPRLSMLSIFDSFFSELFRLIEIEEVIPFFLFNEKLIVFFWL